MKNLEWCGYPTVEKIVKISLFVSTECTNMTNEQMDGHYMTPWAALALHRTAKNVSEYAY